MKYIRQAAVGFLTLIFVCSMLLATIPVSAATSYGVTSVLPSDSANLILSEGTTRVEDGDQNLFLWSSIYLYDSEKVRNVIYFSDGNTSTRISTNPDADDTLPVISGDYIAWMRSYRNPDAPYNTIDRYEILAYHIPTGQISSVRDNSNYKGDVQIKGSKIAWTEYVPDSRSTIYLYDINQSQIIYQTNSAQPENINSDMVPLLSGTSLYWLRHSSDPSTRALLKYTFSSQSITTIIADSGIQSYNSVSVDGDKVAWTKDTADVYYYDGATTQEITSSDGIFPTVLFKGGLVLWLNGTTGTYEYYNVQTGITHVLPNFGKQPNYPAATDGRYIAYSLAEPAEHPEPQVYVKDTQSGELTMINKPGYYLEAQPGSNQSKGIVIIDDFIAYVGVSDILGTGESNVFVARKVTLPDAPVNLSASSPTNQKPSLSWSSSTSATSYKIYRNDSLVGTSSTTSFVDANLSGDGSYSYKVSSVNAAGEGPKSNSATVVYDTTIPTAVNLTLSSQLIIPLLLPNTNVSVDVADGLSGVNRVEYYIDNDPGKGNGAALSYNATSGKATAMVTPTGLSIGQHTLYVRVQDKAGNWSTTVSNNFTYIGL